MRRLNLLVLVLLLVPAANAWAQEVTGNLQGRVLGGDGAPLPSANVTVRGLNLQQPRGAVSGDDGTFHVLALPIGICTVTIRALGHRTVTVDSVRIALGATTSLGDTRMETQAVELPEVVVSGAHLRIDPTTTTIGTNLERKVIAALPTERNFRSVVALAPEVKAESAFRPGDDLRIGGASGYNTVYFVDGIDVTSPLGNLFTVDLPPDFVQEIDIKAGGYEAEFGRATGGIVNLVTQSGGNDFHGRAFGFFTSDRWTGKARLSPSIITGQNLTKYDGGFSLGGRLIRDRLWFYGAYDPGVITQDFGLPGLGLSRQREWSHSYSGKLTWQAAPTTNLVLTAVGEPSGSHYIFPPPFAPLVTSTNPDPYLGLADDGTGAVSLKALHVARGKLLFEGTLSRVSQKRNDTPDPDRSQGGPLYFDFETRALSGGYPFTFLAQGIRNSVGVSVSAFLRKHSLKLGAEYNDNALKSSNTVQPVVIRYDDTTYYWRTYRDGGTAGVRYPVLYVQDGWLATPRLRINAGLRWDALFFTGSDGKTFMKIPDQFAPRLGLVYQVGRLGTQKLSASYGRFYQEFSTELSSSWGIPGSFEYVLYHHNPLVAPTEGDTLYKNVFSGVSEFKGVRGQNLDEFTLGYERLLPARTKLGVRGMYRTVREVVDDAPDLATGEGVVGNPGRGKLAWTGPPRNEYSSLEVSLEGSGARAPGWLVAYVWSRVYGNYEAFSGVTGQYNSPEQLPNSTGLLPGDRTHLLRCFGSYRVAGGLTAGGVLTWQSGTPVSEIGGTVDGPIGFLRPRGSVGRTPAIWDLGLRLGYTLAKGLRGEAYRPTVTFDLYHVASARRVVGVDEVHFFNVDAMGNQINENPNFLKPTAYQPPMAARLGLAVAF